jgi:archaellum component FlaC
MGLGGTARKLQKVTDMAEDVYTRLNDLRDQVVEMRETTQETSDRVERLERESAEMRALLEALAEKEGIDVESVSADAHIFEAEKSDGDAGDDASGNGGDTESDGDVAQSSN